MDKLDEALFAAKRKAQQLQFDIDELRPLAQEFAGLPPSSSSGISARRPETNGAEAAILSLDTEQPAQIIDLNDLLQPAANRVLTPDIGGMSGDEAKIALSVSAIWFMKKNIL